MSKPPTTPLAQLLTVPAADGLLLPALYFNTANPTKRLMIWLHGMGSSGIFYSVDHTNALAAAFTSTGTAFLGLQNRGGGMLQGLKYLDQTGAKQRVIQGTSHELIADCVHDIQGALEFAKARGYTELYLGGHSTGANKVALYHYQQPKNPFTGYVMYGGGDDTGLFYVELGPEIYHRTFAEAKRQVAAGHGADLAPLESMHDYFSYQSTVDILDPDGDYNTFPFYEAQTKRLGTKPLFREYHSITKPSLVIYGANDEYCHPDTSTIMNLLKKYCAAPDKFTFTLSPGADHSGHPHETELAQAIAVWVATVR